MIDIRYCKRSGHVEIEIEGHASSDVLCAVVSGLAQGLIVALEALAEENPSEIRVSAVTEA
jgi:uncharacterized protein YsxB (DUF464 family)